MVSKQMNFVHDMNRRMGEFKSRWRRLKKSGQLEGIANGQKPERLMVGSPLEVLYLKSRRSLPGTEFGVSWSPDDYVTKASIFYGINNLRISEIVILGENKTQDKIEREIKSYSFMPKEIRITREGKFEPVDSSRLKGIFIDCSDSRVLGGVMLNNSSNDVVVISNMGNTLSLTAADAIQVLAQTANPLVVGIVGHNRSEAVNAACAGIDEAELKPLLDGIRADLKIKEAVEPTIDMYTKNILVNLEKLAKIIPEMEEKGIALIPLILSLDNGSTRFISVADGN